ncbi:unnamed protein product [Amoebophrya sp. A25]|nr:unnamed protein product [Amoebophrya sp. A25]|eukprot:GSA25T00003087001.1
MNEKNHILLELENNKMESFARVLCSGGSSLLGRRSKRSKLTFATKRNMDNILNVEGSHKAEAVVASPEDVTLQEMKAEGEAAAGAEAGAEEIAEGAEDAAAKAAQAAVSKKKKKGGCCGGGGPDPDEKAAEVVEEPTEAPKKPTLREMQVTTTRNKGRVLADRRKAKQETVITVAQAAERFRGTWVQQGVIKADDLMQEIGVSDYMQQAARASGYGAGRALMKVETASETEMQVQLFGMGKSITQKLKIGGVDAPTSQTVDTFDGPLDCKVRWTAENELEMVFSTRWGQEVKQVRSVSVDNEEIVFAITHNGITCRRFWRRIAMPETVKVTSPTDETAEPVIPADVTEALESSGLPSDDPEEIAEIIAQQGKKISAGEQLQLYGLYKQAMFGDAPTVSPDPKREGNLAASRWKQWNLSRGKDAAAAKTEYVVLAAKTLVKAKGGGV